MADEALIETPAPIKPWELSAIPTAICNELDRRRTNRSFNYSPAELSGWDSQTGDWTKYKGPMTPWIRVCSNGRGASKNGDGKTFDRQGFVFFGGKNFYNDYGFNGTTQNPSVIGYMPDANHTPHIIDNDLHSSDYPIHVPAPEIERISSVIQKELVRRVTIEWVCFSKKQLEYMTPYFLVPGITVLVEWGWNHYNPESLVNLQNTEQLKNYFHNPYPLYTDNILKSSGNYDVAFGIITNFEWNIEGNKIKCRTEITSKDRIYAGLVVDSTTTVTTQNDTTTPQPMGGLPDFIKNVLPQFKKITSTTSFNNVNDLSVFGDTSTAQLPIVNLISYLKANHKDTWKEYLYGIFYGRDINDKTNPFKMDKNDESDFDSKNTNSDLWINLGLMIEIINFHSAPLHGMGKKEMFRIDIDNVLISGHPNMISGDGAVCLIPNSKAPKYFYGIFGASSIAAGSPSSDTYNVLQKSSYGKIPTSAEGNPADYRLFSICKPMGGRVIYRDNLDEVINYIRYGKNSSGNTFEFPMKSPIPNTSYNPYYTGYLKHIYVNVKFVQSLLMDENIKTYTNLIESMMNGISAACGNFWDFRLVSATGDADVKKDGIATMKIIDNKFPYTANKGRIYTFDYFDADSILQEIGFKPTLSNAKAIETIYGPVNNLDGKTKLSNGDEELLNYQFRDRLLMADETQSTNTTVPVNDDTSFKETMRLLQQVKPMDGSFQITSKLDGVPIVRRLVLPSPEILNALLNDGDTDHNPKYLGIMPNIQTTVTLQGIGGLRTFMMFLVRNLPKPYSETNILFRIIDIQEVVESGKWTTTITAGIIPLRKSIRDRFGIKLNSP
jgi:hypothetical protein